ncbi:rRNA maturation RNase YbeY [Deferrisoma palaeochoriense]
MEIWIRNDRPEAGIDEERLRNRLKSALSASGCDEATELSVWLCSDEDIRDLHRAYFGLDTPTNVISFSQREGEFADPDTPVLGDVVVSLDTAAREAEEAGWAPDDMVFYLCLHGVLHLLGYDHEGDQAHRAAEMEARQEELFEAIAREA